MDHLHFFNVPVDPDFSPELRGVGYSSLSNLSATSGEARGGCVNAKDGDKDQSRCIRKGWTRVDEEIIDGNNRMWRDVFIYDHDGVYLVVVVTMLAQPRPFVPSAQPSTTVIKAAQDAAASQHAQINLIRMVRSLDKSDPAEEGSNAARRRDWEVSDYLRRLRKC